MVRDTLKFVGLIIIFTGGIVFLSAFPSILGIFGINSMEDISSTRTALGLLGIVFGLVIYFGKEGLKSSSETLP